MLTHWSCVFLALTHRYGPIFSVQQTFMLNIHTSMKNNNISLYFPCTDKLSAGHMIVSQVTWSHTCCCSIYSLIRLLDSFTVSLHSPSDRHLPAVWAVQGDSYMSLENCGNSHWSCEPTIHSNWSNPNLYLDQPVRKKVMPDQQNHKSQHPISILCGVLLKGNATLGLCSSLWLDCRCSATSSSALCHQYRK